MKGGVAKTTLCKEIAYYLTSVMNKKILLIDVDPQCNLTQSYLLKYKRITSTKTLKTNPLNKTIESIFSSNNIIKQEDKGCILEMTKNLHMIPGEISVGFIKRHTGTAEQEKRLRKYIESNNLRKDYDYIFIDCPPTYSYHSIVALYASDYYFVPVKPDIYSVLGLDLLIKVIADLMADNGNFKNRKFECLGVISTLVKKRGMKSKLKSIDDYLQEKKIYYFKNNFMHYDRISTGRATMFIQDRSYEPIKRNLGNICEEFLRRIDECN